MSSPDRDADSRPQASDAKDDDEDADVDVEMADDDPVTDLFGGQLLALIRLERLGFWNEFQRYPSIVFCEKMRFCSVRCRVWC